MFTTERLRLRAYSGDKDADLLLTLWNDEVMAPLITESLIVPVGPKFKETLAKLAENALMFCIVEEKEGGTFVGLVGFLPPPNFRNRTTSLSIAFAPPFWSKGYGTEVMNFILTHGFKQLGLHRIGLGVYQWNEHAIQFYQNLGFVEEGREREAIWYDGKYWDILKFGMLEHEWTPKKK